VRSHYAQLERTHCQCQHSSLRLPGLPTRFSRSTYVGSKAARKSSAALRQGPAAKGAQARDAEVIQMAVDSQVQQ
jgi:hypothetical protein